MRQLSLFILTLLLIAVNSYAQPSTRLRGEAFLDSLVQELPKQKDDTNKVIEIAALTTAYRDYNLDKSIKYGRIGLEIASRLKWKSGIAEANNLLGISYDYQSEYPLALEFLKQALKCYNEIGDVGGAASAGSNIGNVYIDLGNYPLALEFYFKALKLSKEVGDKQAVANITDGIGCVYQLQGDFTLSLKYNGEALRLFEEIGDRNGFAGALCNVGNGYLNLGDKTKALECLEKALVVAEEEHNQDFALNIISNIGDLNVAQENYLSAIENYQKAMKIADDIGSRYLAAANLCSIGSCLISIYKTDGKQGASDNLELSIVGKQKETQDIPSDKAVLLRRAIDYLQRALTIAKSINYTVLMQDAYQSLAEAYLLKGEYKKALESYQNYNAIKDSVFSKENEKKIVQQQMQYEYGKREDSLKLVNAGKEKEAALRYVRQRNYTYMGVGGVLVLVVFSFFMFRNNKLLAKEKQRSDDLLLNILPSEVASELKDTGSTVARHFDNTTVLFTDFVNFTQASEQMSPQALIDEMHTCFTKFDEITSKYKIEKIKTIGDAYLAVAGLPVADPSHAVHVVQAAKEITDFMAIRYNRLGSKTFQIRIGIHSGSVVAGIVGVKKFAYDIWGDTVNTAARMEQNSETGKVNISQTTYELVKDQFNCEFRGEVDVKGKGAMKMYFVS